MHFPSSSIILPLTFSLLAVALPTAPQSQDLAAQEAAPITQNVYSDTISKRAALTVDHTMKQLQEAQQPVQTAAAATSVDQEMSKTDPKRLSRGSSSSSVSNRKVLARTEDTGSLSKRQADQNAAIANQRIDTGLIDLRRGLVTVLGVVNSVGVAADLKAAANGAKGQLDGRLSTLDQALNTALRITVNSGSLLDQLAATTAYDNVLQALRNVRYSLDAFQYNTKSAFFVGSAAEAIARGQETINKAYTTLEEGIYSAKEIATGGDSSASELARLADALSKRDPQQAGTTTSSQVEQGLKDLLDLLSPSG